MDLKARGTEALVGGITGLTVVAVYIVVRSVGSNIEAKDWLAFAGVIIGVMLTLGATKLVDWIISEAAERRRKREFILAVRSVATGLTDITNANPDEIHNLAIVAHSLWHVASPLADTLQDLDFEHRAKIGLARIAMDECMPGLLSNASLIPTNPGIAAIVKGGAESLAGTISHVVDLFPETRS